MLSMRQSLPAPNNSKDEELRMLLDALIETVSQKADIIVWLQGDRLDRGGKVLELYKNKQAGKILISGNNILVGIGPRPGENDLPLGTLKEYLLKAGVPKADIIVEDKSLNSAAQARNVLALSKREGWQTLILVTSPYHQPRAFLSFLKAKNELNIPVVLINQPATDLPWREKAGGRDKTRLELWSDEIDKIHKYSGDVASPQEGIAYLKNYENKHLNG